jgi:hypothetical protein
MHLLLVTAQFRSQTKCDASAKEQSPEQRIAAHWQSLRQFPPRVCADRHDPRGKSAAAAQEKETASAQAASQKINMQRSRRRASLRIAFSSSGHRAPPPVKVLSRSFRRRAGRRKVSNLVEASLMPENFMR